MVGNTLNRHSQSEARQLGRRTRCDEREISMDSSSQKSHECYMKLLCHCQERSSAGLCLKWHKNVSKESVFFTSLSWEAFL